MSKFKQLLNVLLLVWLAGCATTPTRNSAPPTDWDLNGTVPATTLQPTLLQPIPMQPSPFPAPPQIGPPPLADDSIAEKWISLERWTRSSGLASPTRLAASNPVAYSTPTPNGELVLRTGTRLAALGGMELQLGFAPRLTNGQMVVHVLDARKNLQPLVELRAEAARPGRTIVIDPGHGGGNTGTRSAFNQHLEKEYTLDWALRLQPLLEASGWRVFLTRTNDMEVPLGDRVTFAEQRRADLFVSLHFNASTIGQEQSGAETYCLTPRGMPSNLTREFEDDPSKAYPNNTFDQQNLQYAARLHRALLQANGHKDRGLRHARFLGVLRGQNRPAVLLEAGYLSNPTEAARIADPAFRQNLAEAVATALQ